MNGEVIARAKFRLGRISATPNALAQITQNDILLGIKRHQAGDWGELDHHDRTINERALTYGGRLVSIYRSAGGVKFSIITETDRSDSTILLPEDY
jgi:hypothetical protein